MQIMPYNIATFGGEVDNLTALITWITVIALIIAELLLAYMLIRFRKRDGSKSSYITGEKWSQLQWVLIPVCIVVGFDFFIDIQNAHAWKIIKEELPNQAMHVRVSGQQFAWTFTIPAKGDQLDGKTDITTVGELHVPVNTNIIFELESKDVLHSFWVPSLRLKQDAVPGRTYTGWFNATRTGIYEIGCAEICGGGHSKMAAKLIVGYPQDLEAFRQKASLASASPGFKLMTDKGCAACHSVDGSARVGPTWKGIYGTQVKVTTNGAVREVTIDDEYIRRAILDPNADVVEGFPANVMPPQRGNVTDAEVDQLIEYIKSLK